MSEHVEIKKIIADGIIELTSPPKEPVLPEVDQKQLLEMAEFSNRVEDVNSKIAECYASIQGHKENVKRMQESLSALILELNTLDELETRVLELVAKRLEK